MSDKNLELTTEQTLSAGKILEVCQEASLKPPSDIMAQMQYWAEQVGGDHTTQTHAHTHTHTHTLTYTRIHQIIIYT